jgi:hypothetical protein
MAYAANSDAAASTALTPGTAALRREDCSVRAILLSSDAA